ncbi:MAG: hypothetical protein K8I02_13290, partial [Candidatus Methylomirabilis sp.]|nr:hypothetical protein [Deltaproteobacteria bacterium]
MGALASRAIAHGGEDHGPPRVDGINASIAGGAHLEKESQFLLGVLTEPLAAREIRARITAPGEVVPRSGGRAELYPPLPGRASLGPNGRLPVIGDRVSAGDILMYIEGSVSVADRAALNSRRIDAHAAA